MHVEMNSHRTVPFRAFVIKIAQHAVDKRFRKQRVEKCIREHMNEPNSDSEEKWRLHGQVGDVHIIFMTI